MCIRKGTKPEVTGDNRPAHLSRNRSEPERAGEVSRGRAIGYSSACSRNIVYRQPTLCDVRVALSTQLCHLSICGTITMDLFRKCGEALSQHTARSSLTCDGSYKNASIEHGRREPPPSCRTHPAAGDCPRDT